MNNAELIKALRYCADEDKICTEQTNCGYYGKGFFCQDVLMRDAADALEADEKRIAELSLDCELFQQKCIELHAQMPKEGEWIEKWRFKTDGTPFHKIGDMECSVCHGEMLGRFYSKYCPHCGALLRGEHDEQIH